jgi:predicted dehydrogenase
MAKKIGICQIGTGQIGTAHAEEYQNFKDKINFYACDQNESKVKEFAEKFQADDWFTDYREVLERKDIVAVDIGVPHNLHAEIAINAAKAGKHILLEKPIATTLREADLIIKEACKNDVVLMIAENYHFEPAVVKTEELIESGVIGKVFLIEANSLHHARFPDKGPSLFRRSKIMCGGGALIDRGVHMIDYLYNLGGEVSQVHAYSHHEVVKEMEGEDTVAADLRYKNGATGRLLVSYGAINSPSLPWLIVYGDHGVIYEVPGKRWGFQIPPRMELTSQINVYSDKVKEYNVPGGKVVNLPIINPFKEEISDFINCVMTKKVPKMTGEIARKDLEIVLAIYKSAETGKIVELPL